MAWSTSNRSNFWLDPSSFDDDNKDDTASNSSSLDDGSSGRWSCCSNAGSNATTISDIFPDPDGESENEERLSVSSSYDDEGSFHMCSGYSLCNPVVPSSCQVYECDALLYDCGCCWCDLCNEKIKKESKIKDGKNIFKEDVFDDCWGAFDSFRKPRPAIWESPKKVHHQSCPLQNYKIQNGESSNVSHLLRYRQPSPIPDSYPDFSGCLVNDYSKINPSNNIYYHMDTTNFHRKTFVENYIYQQKHYYSNYHQPNDESPKYMESGYLHYDQLTDQPIVRMDPAYLPYYEPGHKSTIHMDSAYSTNNLPGKDSSRGLDSTYTTNDLYGKKSSEKNSLKSKAWQVYFSLAI